MEPSTSAAGSSDPPRPDPIWWANTKLAGDWSASQVVSQLDAPRLEDLIQVFSTDKLESMVKVRLLIAVLYLPRPELEKHHAQLRRLADLALCDGDEWVRIVGAAVGDLSGQLDVDAVMNSNRMIKDTISGLMRRLDQLEVPRDYMPLQERYFHPGIRTLPPVTRPSAHGVHFQPRAGVDLSSLQLGESARPGAHGSEAPGVAGGPRHPSAASTAAGGVSGPHQVGGAGVPGLGGLFLRSSRPDVGQKQGPGTPKSSHPAGHADINPRPIKMKAVDPRELREAVAASVRGGGHQAAAASRFPQDLQPQVQVPPPHTAGSRDLAADDEECVETGSQQGEMAAEGDPGQMDQQEMPHQDQDSGEDQDVEEGEQQDGLADDASGEEEAGQADDWT